jgi:hypothetical protein
MNQKLFIVNSPSHTNQSRVFRCVRHVFPVFSAEFTRKFPG